MPAFTARIVKLGPLRSVIVPPKIVAALGRESHIPVIARYAGNVIQTTINPAGGAKRRLVLRVDTLRHAKLDTDDRLTIELTRDASPRAVTLPEDLRRALQFRPAAAAGFERAAPSTRRVVIELLEQSRAPETRARRLEKLIERLAENTAAHATKV